MGRKKVPKQEYDDIRGDTDNGGWWVDYVEAQQHTVGNEKWWTKEGINGKVVHLRQHEYCGPDNKPIWMYNNYDMYLGGWIKDNGRILEHGFGAIYNHNPIKFRGMIYVGFWNRGSCDGMGKIFWLEESSTWKQNSFAGSAIKEKVGKKRSTIYLHW